MSDINPNPSGWSQGHLFIDLEQVVVASYRDGQLFVLFKQDGSKEPRALAYFNEAAWKSLSEALLIYRSHR